MQTRLPTTKRQEQVLRLIARYTAERGYPPTFRELCDALGFKSPNSIVGHLKALRARGLVTWEPHGVRSLRLCQVAPKGMPFLGEIS